MLQSYEKNFVYVNRYVRNLHKIGMLLVIFHHLNDIVCVNNANCTY